MKVIDNVRWDNRGELIAWVVQVNAISSENRNGAIKLVGMKVKNKQIWAKIFKRSFQIGQKIVGKIKIDQRLKSENPIG